MRPLLIVAGLLLALPVQAETLLHLSETAQIRVHPDRLSANLRFEAEGATPVEVQAKVNAAIAAALGQAKKTAGVSVGTGSYSVWQTQADAKAPKRWHAGQGLELHGGDGAMVLTLVGVLQGEGLLVQQLGWGLAPDTARKAHADATRMALKALRGRADDAAAALELGFVSFKTVNLDPSGFTPRGGMMMAAPMMARGAAMPTPVAEATDITVEARIEADAVLDVKK